MSSDRSFDAILPAPFGALGVRMAGGHLAELRFLPPPRQFSAPRGVSVEATEVVATEVAAYFRDPGYRFSLPLNLSGTPFRLRVWAALRAIPPGQTLTYGALARQLGSSARAVGQALGDNPIPIVIPCHRVLGAHGLGGFMHGTDPFPLAVKRWLLAHEGVRL